MSEEQISGFGFFKKMGGWIFTLVYFFSNIISSIFTALKSGDWKPLIDNTLGKVLATDLTIARNFALIQTGNLDNTLRGVLISEIVIMILIMVTLIVFITNFLVDKNHIPLAFSIFISLGIIFVLDVVYFFIVHGFKTPFDSGIYELIKYGVSLI